MISIQIHTKFNRIPIIQASIRPIVSQVVRKTAHDVEADIKTEMRAPKSGRMYRGHQASAPGEAPAVDMGQLINSIQVQDVTDLKSTVGTATSYALPLEFGSRRVAARPVWRPVIEKWRAPFIQALTHVLRQIR